MNVMQLIQMAKSGGNPLQMLQNEAMRDPMAAQAMKMVQGKNPQQIRQMVENMCKERGTTPLEVARQLGL